MHTFTYIHTVLHVTSFLSLYSVWDLTPSTRSHPHVFVFLTGVGSETTGQALLCEGCSSHPACVLAPYVGCLRPSPTSVISTLLCSCLNIHYYHWLKDPLLFKTAIHSIFSILDINWWKSQMTATNARSWIKAVNNWEVREVTSHVFHFIGDRLRWAVADSEQKQGRWMLGRFRQNYMGGGRWAEMVLCRRQLEICRWNF